MAADSHLASGKVGIVYRRFRDHSDSYQQFGVGPLPDRPYCELWENATMGCWYYRNWSIPYAKDNPFAKIDPLAMMGDELREWWKI